MGTQDLSRWGGLVLILTAVLFAGGGIFAAVLPGGGLESPAAPLMFYAGTVTAVVAFTALYAAPWKRSGTSGVAGLLLAVVGATLYSGPQLALVAKTFGAAGWHDVWGFAMGNVLLIGPPLFFIGMILLGAATARSGMFPPWSGRLLAIGAFIWLIAYVLSIVPGLLTLASLITGAGMAWLGWTLWSRRTGEVILTLGAPSS